MRTRWDDIEILRAIDALQEQHGGGPAAASGREVMDGIAGSRVTGDLLISGFAHELDLARGAGLITFEVADHAAAYRTQNTDFYLQNVRHLALTISGRDRARGRVVEVPLPDPGEDDGHLISHLVLGQVAESLHPWVWDAVRKLWESGHRRPAVQAAATAINGRLQDKLGRHDLADDKLLQEAFSDKPAQSGKPRLRIPGDPRNPTVASLQRGAPQFGVGCFWVIRNPATHETADWPPQEALERLAALSVLARLIDMCEVAVHQAAAPGSGTLGAQGASGMVRVAGAATAGKGHSLPRT